MVIVPLTCFFLRRQLSRVKQPQVVLHEQEKPALNEHGFTNTVNGSAEAMRTSSSGMPAAPSHRGAAVTHCMKSSMRPCSPVSGHLVPYLKRHPFQHRYLRLLYGWPKNAKEAKSYALCCSTCCHHFILGSNQGGRLQQIISIPVKPRR